MAPEESRVLQSGPTPPAASDTASVGQAGVASSQGKRHLTRGVLHRRACPETAVSTWTALLPAGTEHAAELHLLRQPVPPPTTKGQDAAQASDPAMKRCCKASDMKYTERIRNQRLFSREGPSLTARCTSYTDIDFVGEQDQASVARMERHMLWMESVVLRLLYLSLKGCSTTGSAHAAVSSVWRLQFL